KRSHVRNIGEAYWCGPYALNSGRVERAACMIDLPSSVSRMEVGNACACNRDHAVSTYLHNAEDPRFLGGLCFCSTVPLTSSWPLPFSSALPSSWLPAFWLLPFSA